MIWLVLFLGLAGCSGKPAPQKIDVDEYVKANIDTAKDVEAQLDFAKQMGKDGQTLKEEAKAADTTPEDVAGALQTKGVSQSKIDELLRGVSGAIEQSKVGQVVSKFVPQVGSAESKLNWNPLTAEAIPPEGMDPDAILPIGPKQFASVLKRLVLADAELAELATTTPNVWSRPSALPTKCEGPRHRRDVCIMQKANYDQYSSKAATGCEGKELFLVHNPAQIRAAFEKLDRDCVEIGSLDLISHGSPGGMAMGLSYSTVDSIFLGTETLFAPDAHIKVAGCSVGKSCLGSVFMLKMARKTFASQTGTILAPVVTTYFNASTTWRSFETDDKKKLTYAPGGQSAAWTDISPKQGLATPTTLAKSCGNEFADEIKRIKRHVAASATLKRCSIARFATPAETLDRLFANAMKILALPEAQLDNLRLRALANLSDLLTLEANEMDLQCR